MRLLLLSGLMLLGLGLNAQLTASFNVTQNFTCVGSAPPIITFTGSGGTGPYTFYYTINGGPTQNITGNPSASLPVPTTLPGNSNYALVSVTDAVPNSTGLSSNLSVMVNPNPVVNAGPDQFICEGQTVVLNGSGALTYSWNQGIMNGVPFMPAFGSTMYTLIGSDANGCTGSDQVTITVSSSPSLSANDVVIDTAYCENGSVQIFPNGGTPPFVYNWSNGSTSQNLTGLIPGVYFVTITDINGCSTNSSVTISSSAVPQACATVSGTIMIDNDQDCINSTGDYPLAYRLVRAMPGNQLAMTDFNGNFTMNLIPGNYTIDEAPNQGIYTPHCQTSYSVSLPDASSIETGLNFYDTLDGSSDLEIDIQTGQIRPQFYSNLWLGIVQWNGAPIGNKDIWFTLPSGITLTQFPYSYTQSNDTVYATITSSTSYTSIGGLIYGTAISIGSQITFNAGIEVDAGETVIANNEDSWTTTVVASYDPNDKTLFLNGVQSDSTLLLSDQVFDYVVRFQNTGTASAIDIYVLDTLAETLDLNSLQFLGSSHPCSVSLLEDRTIKFDFPGINLPDSTSNEPASHGYLRYRIRQAQTNQVGTVINNTAYIYFDLNEAVITNTTWDEIVEPSNSLSEFQPDEVHLYPNPTRNDLNIQSEKRLIHAIVTDLSGKIVHQTDLTGNIAQLGVHSLPAGNYLVRIEMEGGVAYRRFVKQ